MNKVPEELGLFFCLHLDRRGGKSNNIPMGIQQESA